MKRRLATILIASAGLLAAASQRSGALPMGGGSRSNPIGVEGAL